MAIPRWLGMGGPLGGTGGINGGGMYPPWMTPPFNPNAPIPQSPQATTGVPMGMPGVPPPAGAPPTANSPRFPGPAWLQKLSGGFNRFANNLSGAPNPNLSPQEQQAQQQRQRMAMMAALMAGSGPAPQGTRGALQPFGEAMLAGQQAGDQFTADAMRAKLMQAQLAQAQQGAPDPSAIREMQRLGYPLTPDGFKEYNAAQAKPGTTITIGEKLNEPIPIAQLDTVRLPNGQTPPIGTTYAEARQMGAQVLSAEDQKRTQQADQALGILNQISDLAVGPEGVFNNVMPGLANRAASAIQFGLDMIEQKDPRASRFADMSQATLAPFIKFLGESGALAQGDVERALGLLPRIFPLPDTKEVATDKLAALREIITRGVSKMNSVTRQSEQVPPLPPGATLDPEEPE
jgi:hypothetical protein